MSSQALEVGDLVIVLRTTRGSTGDLMGVRAGMIGQVVGFDLCDCGCESDTVVKLPSFELLLIAPHHWLRKIPPLEPGDWDNCVWAPKEIVAKFARAAILRGSIFVE